MESKHMRVRTLASIIIAAALATVAIVVAPVGQNRAEAADLSQFRPGNIISDGVFFNASTMGEASIQAFLSGQVASCATGYTCLKDYGQGTSSRAADAMCSAYEGASWEPAARIIAKVAQACGINPQVILVTLQKEQGLVTHRSPTEGRYRIAMGYACPDTAPCDSQYYGFQNQVYKAAWQFKRYANPPGTSQAFTRYAPGRTASVLFHPDAACGSSQVYIENQATANLYYYTPYQPNGPALAAGYGASSDGCAAYGNRNFFNYFSDWFGTPTHAVGGSIGDYWRAQGASTGPAGDVAGPMGTYANGWAQPFRNQDLFIRSGSIVVPVQGSIRSYYRAWNGPTGVLGWPMAPENGSGPWWQQFERGRVYSWSGGTHYVFDAMGSHYVANGESKLLGLPTESTRISATGLSQRFERRGVYLTGSSSVSLPIEVANQFEALGGTASTLGWPRSSTLSERSPYNGVVLLDGGAFVRHNLTGYWAKGDIGALYRSLGADASWLGRPTGVETTLAGGWSQPFERGRIYASARGTAAVPSALDGAYIGMGGSGGVLGFPIEASSERAGGVVQRFAGGYLAVRNGSAFRVQGSIASHYASLGGPGSALGLPIGGEVASGGGWYQRFDGGVIVVGPAGTHVVDTAAWTVLSAAGGTSGRLGWPSAAATTVDGVRGQQFQGGRIVADRPVWGAILTAYSASARALGAPTSAETGIAGGWVQSFDGGTVYAPAGRSAQAVLGTADGAYRSYGGSGSRLGWPAAAAAAAGAGSTQAFDGGVIAARSNGAAYVVTGQLLADWRVLGAATGRMQYPTQQESYDGRGWVQRFDGGTLLVRASDGRSLRVVGALADGHQLNGGLSGRLGWPTANEALVNGSWQQTFVGGTLRLNADGTFTIL